MLVTKRQFLLWICDNLEEDIYAMYMYIVNSRWGRDRVASDIYWHLSWKSIPSTRCYIYFCVLPDFDQNPKAFLPLCGWVCLVSEVSGCHSPLFVRGKNAALCRTTRAPQPGMRCGNARPAAPGWTSQVRHRLLSSRSPASSSSSWPTNKEVTSSNKLRRTQAGGACSIGSQAKQTWLSERKPSPVQQL